MIHYLPDGLNINYTELMQDVEQDDIDSDYETDETEDDDADEYSC